MLALTTACALSYAGKAAPLARSSVMMSERPNALPFFGKSTILDGSMVGDCTRARTSAEVGDRASETTSLPRRVGCMGV